MISSAEEFVRLRTSQDPELYQRAARDSAPDQVWQDVIANYPEMRRWVVHNKTVPLHILVQLSTDESDDVRYAVATKRKLSLELFETLATDPCDSVRHAIALNKSIPADVLAKLESDSERFVAQAARRRRNQRRKD